MGDRFAWLWLGRLQARFSYPHILAVHQRNRLIVQHDDWTVRCVVCCQLAVGCLDLSVPTYLLFPPARRFRCSLPPACQALALQS